MRAPASILVAATAGAAFAFSIFGETAVYDAAAAPLLALTIVLGMAGLVLLASGGRRARAPSPPR